MCPQITGVWSTFGIQDIVSAAQQAGPLYTSKRQNRYAQSEIQEDILMVPCPYMCEHVIPWHSKLCIRCIVFHSPFV